MIETGIYVRIERAGKWQPVDVGEMTEAELGAWTEWMPEAEARRWVVGLVDWIQTQVRMEQRSPDAESSGYVEETDGTGETGGGS